MGFETAVSMLQAISTTDATPMVRCPSLDAPSIMRLLDAILATPRLDGIYVSRNDLAPSPGERPGAESGGVVAGAIATIVAATRKRRLVAGIFYPTSSLARQRLAEGFHLVKPENDANMFGLACKSRVDETLTTIAK